MKKKITVIGSTGLLGKEFLESLAEDDFSQVIAITRREIPGLMERAFIKQSIHDFSEMELMRTDLKTDVLVVALGTTIKVAGSQEAFKRIDHDIPLEIARIALEEGCQSLILISSVGAEKNSSIFYSKVKGQLEDEVSQLGFNAVHILRPSLLLGDRNESRPGERLGKFIMTLLYPIIPWKYKPIHANKIASAIQRFIQDDGMGIHIHEGKELF